MSRLGRIVLAALLAIFCPRASAAAGLTLAWDPPSDASTTGFVLYYGTASHSYTQQVNVGSATSFTVSGLTAGTTYFFAVRAYNAAGVLSDFSDEVSGAPDTTPPPPPPPPPAPTPAPPPPPVNTCSGPDPFAALGGGVCYNGGWYPPGMAPGGSAPASPSQPVTPPPPPPVAPPPPPVPQSGSGGCSTPDPFLPMGGGVCYNGGWLPPGMVVPQNNPTPSTPQAPAPSAPAPTAPPVSTPPLSTCSTPNPFAAMGGGTCYNGGWLPPGMPPPSGAPLPAPPATPSTPGVCTTPDPFVSLGGGLCVNGGWRPRSMGGGN